MGGKSVEDWRRQSKTGQWNFFRSQGLFDLHVRKGRKKQDLAETSQCDEGMRKSHPAWPGAPENKHSIREPHVEKRWLDLSTVACPSMGWGLVHEEHSLSSNTLPLQLRVATQLHGSQLDGRFSKVEPNGVPAWLPSSLLNRVLHHWLSIHDCIHAGTTTMSKT